MKKVLVSVSKNKEENYVKPITLAGGMADACYLPDCLGLFHKAYEDLLDYFSKTYDSFILGGGGDIDPARFGEKLNGSIRIDVERDMWECDLIKRFMELGKPIMGICRGHQVMNVALGGTIYQDAGIKSNEVHMSSGSVFKSHSTRCKSSFLKNLYGDEFTVNSYHHQILKSLANDLLPIQYASDGCVEGAVHKSYPYIGVQWHPECMCEYNAAESYVDGTKIFDYFMSMEKLL